MAPSISALSMYLTGRESSHFVQLTWREETDGSLSWKAQRLPWNGRSCLALICYVLKLSSCSNHDDPLIDTIRRLNDLVSEYAAITMTKENSAEKDPEKVEKKLKKKKELTEMFVNSFMPNTQKFFTVPNIAHLAGFMHFLLQLLNSEADHVQNKERYVSLQKGLMFLLAVIGDLPFQHSELEEVRNFLEEIEALVNEIGSFVYSCVFSPLPVNDTWFCVCMHVFFYKFHLLNGKIEERCLQFAKLPISVNPKSTNAAVDSLFIVESLLADLENLMNHRVHLTGDMKDHVEKIHEELMSSRSFLKEISIHQDREIEPLKECVVQIRDVTYEAEYLINSFVSENFPIWYVTLRIPNVIQKFEVITKGFGDIKKIYDIEVLKVPEDGNSEKSSKTIVTPMAMDDNVFVGFKNETIEILDELTGGSENLQIISIFGMPGIGKTTLAKKLYNDGLISSYFDERAWCVVSQTYKKRNVLVEMLMSLRSMLNKETVLIMEEDRLVLAIYQILKGRRYLLVIDDVWNSDVWGDLRRCFPDDTNGSRILFTSRIRDVGPTNIIHTLTLLSDNQCWELLEKKLFCEEHCPPQLLCFGKQIAAKCNGLPLAVVVIAGILANMEKKKSVWEKVEKSLDSYTSNCMKILELSYTHLPNYLKLCFLYFGVFPEDAEIRVRKLIWLWIAEGFIQKQEEKSLEDVAEGYLRNLIDRSLVLISTNKSTGGVKACHIHDLLRDMCLRRAQEENFMTLITDDHASNYGKHPRLCVHSTSLSYVRPFSIHCRSFFGHLSDPSSCFPQMKLLKIMELPWNIEDVGFYYKLRKIDLLVHLRYLVVDRLPDSILGNLINLEFLRVDSLTHAVYLPPAILKMEKLRHIHVRVQAKFEKDCDIPQTNNLESLSFLSIYNDRAYKILKCSPHLRKLKCLCIALLPDFSFLTKLESLKIGVRDIFQIRSNFTEINLPSTIKKLTLFGTFLPWERMSEIGRLPNLQVLKLLADAFDGEEWETSDEEFQELRFLKLEGLKLEKWNASSEHFPKLGRLVLSKCEKLQKISTELGDVLTLQMIEVHNCSYETSLSVVEIEQEQRENGNEELKVIITNDGWSKEQLLSKYREVSKT